MSEYSEKLKDPRWQKRRLEIMNRGQSPDFAKDFQSLIDRRIDSLEVKGE